MGQASPLSGKLQDMGSATAAERTAGCAAWVSSGKASRSWGCTANVGWSTSSEAEQETFRPLAVELTCVT